VTRRDWIALTAFVVSVALAAATVAIVLHDRSGHRSDAPANQRQISFCYPNQGTGGC
jgi:hypothetical protein